MIKEDSLGDTNKLYLTLHEVYSLLLENCKMGWKAEGFYRVKNKEQGTEKLKVSEWLGPHNQPCLGMRKPRIGLVFGEWLTGYTVFLAKRSIHGDTEVI